MEQEECHEDPDKEEFDQLLDKALIVESLMNEMYEVPEGKGDEEC